MKEEVVTVSSKGQIVLPNTVREKLDIEKGSKIVILLKDGWILMKPMKRFSELRGILKGVEKTSEELIREIRNEWDERIERMVS